MSERFAAYFAATNKAFALRFPLTVLCAVGLWHGPVPYLWLAPAAIAAIEAMAKAHELRARKRQR